MHTTTAKVRSIQGPEMLPNGGSKFYVSLDDGTSAVTFSKNCAQALMKVLDQPVEFTFDAPPDPTTVPRIELAVHGSTVLYDRAAAAARAPGASGGAQAATVPQAAAITQNFYQDETTRAVEFAMSYLSAWNAAVVNATGTSMPNDLLAAKLIDISALAHQQILELRKPQPDYKAETEMKIAEVVEAFK